MESNYAYYVLILHLSEDLFWNAEYSELLTIAADKIAYEQWLNYSKQKMIDRESKKGRRR